MSELTSPKQPQSVTEDGFARAYQEHLSLVDRVRDVVEPLQLQIDILEAEIKAAELPVTASQERLEAMDAAYRLQVAEQYRAQPDAIPALHFLQLSHGLLGIAERLWLVSRFGEVLDMFLGNTVGKSLEIRIDTRTPPSCIKFGEWHEYGGSSGHQVKLVPERLTTVVIRVERLDKKPQVRYTARDPGNIIFDVGQHTVDLNGTVYGPGDEVVHLPLACFLERTAIDSREHYASVKIDGREIYGNPTEAELAEERAEMDCMLAAVEMPFPDTSLEDDGEVELPDMPLTAVDVPPDSSNLGLENDHNLGPGLDAPDCPQ